jgi:enoyl-CoA hydratase/carnithine racemase
MRLAMGFPLAAEEAHRIGLAQWVVPHARLLDKTLEVATHLASLPPLSARLTKESLLRSLDIPTCPTPPSSTSTASPPSS